ncbi:MAG: SusC/RagA family TonB-linked outer membrane protein [Chitinophagaceae bacterium]|nr:MAG: SusC/RagA family TonB-linked outer membrane protein [Chitinophagaceae bacterium]
MYLYVLFKVKRLWGLFTTKTALVMQLTSVILLAACLQVSAFAHAQTVSISGNHLSLHKVFKEIRQQTGYNFIYTNEELQKTNSVTLHVKDATLKEVLEQCLVGQPVDYMINDKIIIIKPKSSIPDASLLSLIKISGRVSDSATHVPLAGVTIQVKGSTIGTMTDNSGNFSLEVPDNAVLVISYLGYNKKEVSINNQTSIDITLSTSTTGLNQLVVVGYGVQRLSDVTGSVSSVPKDRLSKLPVTNVLQAMEGSVAGVNITSGSSVPGSSPSIYIRGLNSIKASTDPLIVLNGLPFSGSWNDINPNDIASIEILKDASATAIYGTRGSNGVILVTTKKGKEGKPKISYNGYAGPEFMTHVLQPMTGSEYVQKNLAYDAETNSNPEPVPNLSEQANYKAGKTTDWIKQVTQQGIIQNHELNVSGGSDFAKYYLSGAYYKERGTIKGYQYHRISLRSDVDLNITDWLKAGADLMYVNGNGDGPHVSLALATEMSPYGQEYNPDGTYNIYPMNPETLYANPLVELYNTRIDRSKNLTGNFYAEISPDFIKGLKYRLNYGTSYLPALYEYYTTRASGDLLGTATVNNSSSSNWILENLLTYAKQFGKHSIDITALYSAQQNRNEYYDISDNSFINDQLTFYNLGSAQTQTTTSGMSQSSLLSQMLRINYNYANKYLLTATARRDGYSGFGLTNKYGLFPSIAVGWNIADENFMRNVRAVSQLKLRISYGTTGNEAVSPYQTLSTLGTKDYVYGQTTAIGLIASRMGNSDLKWESTTELNVGVDFQLFNDRIRGTVEAYQSKTKNLLLQRQIPSITGYTSILDNIGGTQNRGIEITLNTHNLASGNFSWNTGINFSLNRNKITQLYGDNKDDIGNKWFIGKPLEAVYDYVLEGVWQAGQDPSKQDPSAKSGDLKFRDLNGDGKITSADRMYLGTGLPSWIGGMTNTFTYKNFTLNIFIQTFQGALRNNPALDWKDQAGRINMPAKLGYWTSDNKNNSQPSLAYINSRRYGFPEKDSYTRIKDITLTYTVPHALLEKYKLANLSIYLSGRNLHTFTNWFGWDPEVDRDNGNALNSTDYPNTGSVVLGVNVGLQ